MSEKRLKPLNCPKIELIMAIYFLEDDLIVIADTENTSIQPLFKDFKIADFLNEKKKNQSSQTKSKERLKITFSGVHEYRVSTNEWGLRNHPHAFFGKDYSVGMIYPIKDSDYVKWCEKIDLAAKDVYGPFIHYFLSDPTGCQSLDVVLGKFGEVKFEKIK